MRSLAIALVHHPVLGREGQVLTTTLTNLDLHDLSRCARTYGLTAFYAVHPLSSQRLLAERIRRHWTEGGGNRRIPDRGTALKVLRIVSTLEDAERDLGPGTERWTTAAVGKGGALTTFAEGRARLADSGPPVLLCFGTGWGLAPDLLEGAAVRLQPIAPPGGGGYNHLSVRAACAIALDRLLG